jgi:hypothetical protein
MTTGKKANDHTAVAISMRLNPRCNILGFHGWAGSLQISIIYTHGLSARSILIG